MILDPRECLARLTSTGTPPDAETALRISVGLDERISRFRNETLPFIAAGGAELQFVFAPYGRGKTHLLKALQETAHQSNFVSAYVDCATGRSPFASLRTTYSQIATSLNPPLASKESSSGVGGIRELVRVALANAGSQNVGEFLEKLTSDARLSTGYRNLVASYARTVWSESAPDPGWKRSELRDQLGAMMNASTSVQSNMSRLYKEWPTLHRPIAKIGKRNAAAWVRSVAALPVALGFPGLVILFDETEKTHSMKKLTFLARQEHLANLRNLVDHLATGAFRGCAIFYAVVEEFLDIARAQLEALSQRVERIRLGGDPTGS